MYRPSFVPQLDGSKFASSNCNMAAAAMIADAATLGIKRYTAAQMRTASGDMQGGTNIQGAVTALDKRAHVTLQVVDGLDWISFAEKAQRGFPFILHGDYSVIPADLAGSKTFDGLHSVYGQFESGWLIYDPLDDARRVGIPQAPIKWPGLVVERYAKNFPGRAIMAGFVNRIFVNRKVAVANIRSGPRRTSKIVGRMHGMTASLLTGGTVAGENIGGNSRWFRVWYNNHFAYLHSSVAHVVRTDIA